MKTQSAPRLKVGVEATSLIGPRSGVGHTTASVVQALVTLDEGVEVTLLPVSLRRGGWVREALEPHPRVKVARNRLPGRIAHAVWSRADWPPAELFCGDLDVFWGPNFLLPPLVKAAGVMTIHDIAFLRVPEMCDESVLRFAHTVPRMAARANRLIAPSRFVADEIASWLPDEAGRVRVVHPGVRRVFRERGAGLTTPRREALGITDPYAVFVGNVELRKNVDVLLKAFSLVTARHPQAQLVVVGSRGVGWEGIESRNSSMLASRAVRVVGYLPDEEVAAIVRGARVFVYPSRYEGFGIPPLEALACGTPVVAARTSSLPEALGENAHWVDPDDVDALAAAIEDHLEGRPDPSVLEAGRKWASAFTWAQAAGSTLDVFSEAVEEVRA